MKFGSWEINAVVDAMPQKVATAMGELSETLVGATYDPIAYLGSQVVNGTNHAVLAKQTLITGVDQVNIVIIKFSEREMTCSLYGIETILEGGPSFGGYNINVVTGDDLTEEFMERFNSVTGGWVGANVTPVALIATKVVKGINEVYVCTVTPVVPNAKATLKLVTINSTTKTIDFEDLL